MLRNTIDLVSEDIMPAPVTAKKAVGIWKPEVIDGELYFQRDVIANKAIPYWAQVNTIPPKGSRKRIVFLGESVARGYLFDPYFNPSICLQQLLDSGGLIEAEVVDLAKVSIELDELTALTQDCIELNPDAIIVFAGNNWFSYFRRDFTGSNAIQIEKIIAENSSTDAYGNQFVNNVVFEKIKHFVDSELSRMAEEYINFLSKISKDQNIPAIIIIPEFNLADWKSTETERILSRIADDELDAWLNCKYNAEKALKNKDLQQLAQMAGEMIKIDFSHPLGYELLAAYYMASGENKKAAVCLENARDTSMFCRSSGQARIYRAIQNTLLKKAAEENISVINLPEIFNKHLNGELPGRNLFIDYCHLNEHGIILAMSHTANKINELLNPSGASDTADNTIIDIDKNVKAIAYLCAAVHNSHYGQDFDIVNYLCSKAFEHSDIVIELVKRYADFASRKITTVLCKSHDEVVESETVLQYQHGSGFTSRADNKLMDIDIVNSIISQLKLIGVNLEEQITDLRIQEHGINLRTVDLLETYYRNSSYDSYCGKDVPYFRARNIESKFYLITDGAADAKFKITYRTPTGVIEKENVLILINDTEVQKLVPGNKWQTVEFTISKKYLKRGVNHFKINWPYLKQKLKLNRKDTIDDTVIEKMSAVFGEIHMLKASGSNSLK